MKIKFYNLLQLSNLYPKFKDNELTFSTSYKLVKLFKSFEQELNFYNEKLQEVIKKYAQYDENGQIKLTEDKANILIQSDKVKECQDKINELNNLSIEISDIKFTLEELKEVKLSVSDIMLFSDFIEE